MWANGLKTRLRVLQEEYDQRRKAIPSDDGTLTEEERDALIDEVDEWYDAAVRNAPYCLYGRAGAGFPWKVI